MNVRKYIIPTIIFFLSALTALTHATLIELNASADSGLRDDWPTTSNGTNLSFAVLETFKVNRGLMRWTTPDDLVGSTVASASIKLYVRYLNDPDWRATDSVLNIYSVTQNWDEEQVTWLNATDSSLWSLAGNGGDLAGPYVTATFGSIPYSNNLEQPSDDQTITIDVTTLVQNWADGDANNGLMIVSGNTSVNNFFTRETGYPSTLSINYAVPEPATAGLLAGSGLLITAYRRMKKSYGIQS